MLFVLICCCFVFYLMVYRYTNTKQASLLLNNELKFYYKSFICESLFRITRNLLRGFLHAYFLSNYNAQIVGLTVIGLLMLLLILKFRKNYENCLIFFLFFSYHFIFFIFDLFLALCNFLSS